MVLYHRVTLPVPSAPRNESAGTHFKHLAWVERERGTVRVKCLAQERNAITRGKAQTWNPAQLGHRASTFLNIVTMVTLTFTIPIRWIEGGGVPSMTSTLKNRLCHSKIKLPICAEEC